MKAIGRIDHCDAEGKISVNMFFNGTWKGGSWILENRNEMPENHPAFGVFEFEECDQFCKWIDPNEPDPLIQELIDERDESGCHHYL